MSDLTETWAALERYQPYADKAGHGESWKRMTTERKVGAIEAAASEAAWSAAGEGVKDVWATACAYVAVDKADKAVWAETDPEEAERFANLAIEYINKAMEVQP